MTRQQPTRLKDLLPGLLTVGAIIFWFWAYRTPLWQMVLGGVIIGFALYAWAPTILYVIFGRERVRAWAKRRREGLKS